ncbi:hypothetical protein D9613_000677 [Agrocybe pediades]|uniref:Uncharacterized protein n=1 Tax=Agrocybe pediades TaxID=84607 RepID=A0A8H4VT55_9AGAR|nr:hypothetical protein D9613_000677 [Agrocybe pediades]
MLSMESKEPHIKGQSRVLKACHWCLKKQDPNQKPFQACGRCKEVIYCVCFAIISVKPFSPTYMPIYGLTQNVAKAAASENPGALSSLAVFKKWHSLHLASLRHAAICALDLGHRPDAVDKNIIFVKVELKPDHQNLPPKKKYMPVMGFTLTLEEARQMLGYAGGKSILDSFQDANVHMKKKGGLGVTAVMLQAGDVVDFVKILLPSPAATKHQQDSNNWGEDWLQRLRVAVELD